MSKRWSRLDQLRLLGYSKKMGNAEIAYLLKRSINAVKAQLNELGAKRSSETVRVIKSHLYKPPKTHDELLVEYKEYYHRTKHKYKKSAKKYRQKNAKKIYLKKRIKFYISTGNSKKANIFKAKLSKILKKEQTLNEK